MFLIVLAAVMCCLLTLSISAASTNEFGTPETVEGIDLSGMNADNIARVVLVDGNGNYHTYLTSYILSNSTKFKYNFTPINNALGTSYTKNSVVRIEVPDNIEIAANCGDLSSASQLIEIKFFPTSELHTLEYGCFYNNKKLQKLNIPKKVTTIGTLVINNSSLEELIFDDGFCAVPPKDSFVGASGLKKVVFSNQMTTVHRDSFFGTFGSKLEEVYLGASLIDLGDAAKVDSSGSDGGNFSYADGPMRIYASANLFANIDKIERGRLNGWTGTRLIKGVVFYTGTKEQAQALIDKAESDTPIFNNATLVEWDPSKADDEYMPTTKSWNIVYNYNVCNAFYQGQHALTGVDTAVVKDFFTEISVGDICTREGCGVGTVKKTIAPIFEYLGYSSSQTPDANGKYGITMGYKINRAAYDEFIEYGELQYGFVISSVDITGECPLTVENGEVVAVNAEKTILAKQNTFRHNYVDVKLTGLDKDKNGKRIVMCMYAFNKESITYLNEIVTVNVPLE